MPAGVFKRDDNAANTSSVSAFSLGVFEVTQGQYKKVMGNNPSKFQGDDNRPVLGLNCYDCLVFCNRLSKLQGLTPVYSVKGSTDTETWGTPPEKEDQEWNAAVCNWEANGFRLPTNDEWLWAVMGAQDARNKSFPGSDGANSILDYAWTEENAAKTTHPAGSKKPNELGFFDMSGNAPEWLWDYRTKIPDVAHQDYRGSESGQFRSTRGGDYMNASKWALITGEASASSPEYRTGGLRLVKP